MKTLQIALLFCISSLGTTASYALDIDDLGPQYDQKPPGQLSNQVLSQDDMDACFVINGLPISYRQHLTPAEISATDNRIQVILRQTRLSTQSSQTTSLLEAAALFYQKTNQPQKAFPIFWELYQRNPQDDQIALACARAARADHQYEICRQIISRNQKPDSADWSVENFLLCLDAGESQEKSSQVPINNHTPGLRDTWPGIIGYFDRIATMQQLDAAEHKADHEAMAKLQSSMSGASKP